MQDIPSFNKFSVGEKPPTTGEQWVERRQPTLLKPVKEMTAGKPPTGEQPALKLTGEPSATGPSAGEPTTGENLTGTPTLVQQAGEDSEAGDKEGEQSGAEESTDSDVVEVQVHKPGPRRSGRLRGPPERLTYHVCLHPAAFTTLYVDAEDEVDLPELDPDIHADPEHRWDIATMTVKEALVSWKGKAVKAAMDKEIRSLISMGTWELVDRPCGVNIMKNRWNVMTKYHIDDTVPQEKARLVVKGFMQEHGTDNDETYAPVSSYVTLRIFLSIVAILDLNLMQLDVKNAFLQSELDRVLYMYQPEYYDDGTGREREEEEYRQKVGSLQFAATTTRPEIVFACSKLGSGLTVRSDQHWREVDRCLAYLANTRDTAVEFGGGPDSLKMVGYVYADDADDKQNRTSTGGYVFVYRGAAVSWSSKCIKCAILSSTESEYLAATEAVKEGRQLRFLLSEFQLLDARTLTVLRVDNMSAITVAEGLGLQGNLKHMEQQYARLQHMVKRMKFTLKYIPTTEQPADFLTEALHYPAFNRCPLHGRRGDGVLCVMCTPTSYSPSGATM
ncbi:unnamed protein product [Closterium sp. NIES-53]